MGESVAKKVAGLLAPRLRRENKRFLVHCRLWLNDLIGIRSISQFEKWRNDLDSLTQKRTMASALSTIRSGTSKRLDGIVFISGARNLVLC